jgi:hypothetical protein
MTPVCHAEERAPSPARWQIALGTCACAAATAYVYAVDPARGAYPQCFLYQTTGFYCAGCGATRALHALLHGRVLEALHDNVLFVSLLPAALALAAIYAWQAWHRNAWPVITVPERSLLRGGLAVVALCAGFMVLRNLPGAPFDLLRPAAG